jgi:hypothetical protein
MTAEEVWIHKTSTLQDCIPVISVVSVTRSFDLCVYFVDHCVSFCNFVFLAIELSVLLRNTDYDYPFLIFLRFVSNISLNLSMVPVKTIKLVFVASPLSTQR